MRKARRKTNLIPTQFYTAPLASLGEAEEEVSARRRKEKNFFFVRTGEGARTYKKNDSG
jgi:hypothetical protein